MPSIEITTLQERPHLLPEVLALVEDAFDYSPPNQFARDFYPLVKKSNHHNLYVLLENNTLAAHVGFLPKTLLFCNTRFPVTLIGGVSTARDKRGKGYFDRLMTKILVEQSHCMGYLLWGNLERLYKKYQFHPIGVLREQKGHSSHLPTDYTPTLYSELSPPHQQQIKNIHQQSTQDFISLERDWDDIEKITSARLYIKQNQRSEVTNYLFMGKGRDLSGIIHESFGLPNHPKHLSGLPCWMPDLPPYTHWPTLYGCLFKMGNPHLLKKFITLYTDNALTLDTIDTNLVHFDFDGQTIRLKPVDFLNGLFGPHFIDEFKQFYSPLWIGGLDSV